MATQIWIDVVTGTYGILDDIRVVSIPSGTFADWFMDAADERIKDIGLAYGARVSLDNVPEIL